MIRSLNSLIRCWNRLWYEQVAALVLIVALCLLVCWIEMQPSNRCNEAAPPTTTSTREFVKQSLRNCLLNTSLRGPRRIVVSETRCLSYFWVGVCCSSLLLLTAHFYQLVQTYLSYQTYMLQTDLKQDNAASFPTEFPDIVICPHQMFSNEASSLWTNKSVPSPWQLIRNYKARTNRHSNKLLNLPERDLRVLLDSFNYPATLGYYLNSLTDDEALKLGRGSDMLIDCSVSTNGRRRTRHNCPIKLSKLIYRKYLVCLLVTVDSSVSHRTHEVNLFLDSGPRWESLGSEFMQQMVSYMQDYEQLGRGFTLWLKQPGRPFDPLSKRVFLQPSRVSRVTFKERIELKLQGPYPGTCEPSSHYSQMQCSIAEFVRHVQSQCQCNFYEDRSLWQPELPHCTELLENLTESLLRNRCVDRIEQSYSQNLADPCPVPCRRHLFNMDVSSADFDLPRWFLCFLQRPIFQAESPAHSVHQCLGNISQCSEYATKLIRFVSSTIDNLTAVTQVLSNCNLSLFVNVPLSQVVSVVLYRGVELPVVLRQQYIVTPSLLFSQIGGASSLYLGLSLTFFAEIVDWLVRLVRFRLQGGSEARASSAEGNKAMIGLTEGMLG